MKLTNKFLPKQSWHIYYDHLLIRNLSSKVIFINKTGYCRKNVYKVEDLLDPQTYQSVVYSPIKYDFTLKLKTKEGVAYCLAGIDEVTSTLTITIKDNQ